MANFKLEKKMICFTFSKAPIDHSVEHGPKGSRVEVGLSIRRLLLQSKKLNKGKSEGGERLLELGNI